MAQTIALQRGSTSITWNGTTHYTAFTNTSSGTATRVIMGGVSAYANNTDALAMAIYVKQSGTSNYIPVAYKGTGTGVANASLDFYSGCDARPLQSLLAGTGEMMSNPFPSGNTNGSYTGAATLYNVNVNYNQTQARMDSNRFAMELYPQQFWIGPSDVVSMKFINGSSGNYTGAVAWTFVTITES